MKELPAGFTGTIPVENRYHFTNLDQCDFQWALVNHRKPQDVLAGYILQRKVKGKGSSSAGHKWPATFNRPLINIKNMMP